MEGKDSVIYQEYFNYYLELERDFFLTEPYVTIDVDNFSSFSIQYNRMYQSICSEIDSLLKAVCKQIEPDSSAKNIGAYYKIIHKHFGTFNEEVVYFFKSRIELQPWKEWTEAMAPKWWTSYNNLKHHRMEIDEKTEKPYYKCANLENVMNALAALYIVEQYFIYSYDFSRGMEITQEMKLNPPIIQVEIMRRKAGALERNKSRMCCMKRWQDAFCYQGFMGQEFFEIENLEKLIGSSI